MRVRRGRTWEGRGAAGEGGKPPPHQGTGQMPVIPLWVIAHQDSLPHCMCARTPSKSVIARVLLAAPQMLPTAARQGPAEKGAYYDKDGHKPQGLQEPLSNRWSQAQHSARCCGHWWFGTQPEMVSEGVSEMCCQER